VPDSQLPVKGETGVCTSGSNFFSVENPIMVFDLLEDYLHPLPTLPELVVMPIGQEFTMKPSRDSLQKIQALHVGTKLILAIAKGLAGVPIQQYL